MNIPEVVPWLEFTTGATSARNGASLPNLTVLFGNQIFQGLLPIAQSSRFISHWNTCLTLRNPYELQPSKLLCPWDFLGKNKGLPFPSPGDLSDPGIKPMSLYVSCMQVGSSLLSHLGSLIIYFLFEGMRQS